jgi:hypothetical protein
MKKTILALFIITLFYSCSDDGKDEYDITDDLSYLNFQNERFKGVWYFNKVIKADGSIENYNHFCPANKDYVDFQPSFIRDYYHWDTNDCNFLSYGFSCGNYFVNGYTLTNCNSVVEGNYSYSNATNTLRVDYTTVRFFSNPDNNMVNVKGLIFTRN